MRLFVAARPPGEVVEMLAALPRPHIPGARWTTADQWHVTLRFFGEVDDPQPIEAALSHAQLAPATATMGPSVKRLGHLLWAPVAGLEDVAATVVDATRPFGKPPERRRFRGHITLMRQRSSGRQADVGWRASIGATWAVQEIELIRSHLDRDGARYETLERFELPAR
jgi:2'-5' RNA ligase